MKDMPHIRVATRKSPLALAQAEIVRHKLLTIFEGIIVDIIPMSTTGDENMNLSLAEIGGKGLFTKELEEGLLSGRIDVAVHSLKDVETRLPQGLLIAAMLEREDPRDVLITRNAESLSTLAKGACVGTSSLRRAAQLKIKRPDLRIVPFRGNIATRLAKLESGVVDATMLALAGLKRLHMEHKATEILSVEDFIPAVGQGIIAIECHEKNTVLRDMLMHINHTPTFIAATCERSLLSTLDGSCRTPIAGYAELENGVLRIDALVANKNGVKHVRMSKTGDPEKAAEIGRETALEMLANGGKACLT